MMAVWVLGSVAISKKCATLIDIITTHHNARLKLEAMMVLSKARSSAIDANRLSRASYARARGGGGVAHHITNL